MLNRRIQREDFFRRTGAGIVVILLLFLCLVACRPAARAATATEAAGGVINLSTSSSTIKKGDVFSVVCRVSSATGVFEADFFVDYNTSVLEFVEGGAKAEKEVGGVHIRSLDNTDSPVRRTFSLKFVANKTGEATVFIRDGAHVMDGEGTPLSVRTNRLDLVVNETGEPEEGAPAGDGTDKPGDPAGQPTPTPQGNLSGNNKVKTLTTNATEMVPEFDPEVATYDAVVDPATETFFINYELEDDGAKARIKGNTGLKFGKNKVKLIVTAENGKKKSYVFLVTRNAEKPESHAAEETASGQAADVKVPLDKDDHNGYSIVLYIIIALLAVFSISMVVLVRRQRHELDTFYIEEEEREKQIETENDSRG